MRKKTTKLFKENYIYVSDEEINKNLTTNFIGHNIKYFKTISSTNDKGKELGSDINIIDGTIVISEEQDGGKGRLGRKWSSPKGGIWMSIILRPNITPIHAHKITQIASVALIKTFKQFNIDGKIKWPNDVYVNEKKVSGILTEMKCDMDKISYIIVGIGINVNLDKEDFPSELKYTATSLKIETNKIYNRSILISTLLNNFEKIYLDFIENNNYSEVIKISTENSFILDKDAYLVTSKKKEKVRCIGLDHNGELIVLDHNGNRKNILSGEITFK